MFPFIYTSIKVGRKKGEKVGLNLNVASNNYSYSQVKKPNRLNIPTYFYHAFLQTNDCSFTTCTG